MKSIFLVTGLVLTSCMAQASLTPDVPAEASLGGNTLYISSDAADVIYDKLNVTERVDSTSQIKPIFIKKAAGIECDRHMNGEETMCTIKLNSKGIAL